MEEKKCKYWLLWLGLISGILIAATAVYLIMLDNSKNILKKDVGNESVSCNYNCAEDSFSINFEAIQELMGIPDDYFLNKYAESSSKNLVSYLSQLDNSCKLELGFVGDGRSFDKVKKSLIDKYGNDLGVEPKDYYFDCPLDDEDYIDGYEPIPDYKYNERTKKYEYNEEIGGGDAIEGSHQFSFYLYKLKNITKDSNEIKVTYYALSEISREEGPIEYYDKNNRYINEILDINQEFGEYDAHKYFETNKKDFLQITYIFEIDNAGNLIIKDFQKN